MTIQEGFCSFRKWSHCILIGSTASVPKIVQLIKNRSLNKAIAIYTMLNLKKPDLLVLVLVLGSFSLH